MRRRRLVIVFLMDLVAFRLPVFALRAALGVVRTSALLRRALARLLVTHSSFRDSVSFRVNA